MEKLTQTELKKLLYYDPETGIFTWKQRILSQNRKSRMGGRTAGSLCKRGCLQIGINRKRFKAHRLAILYTDGYFPEGIIDHIDRDATNNKRKNLREVSQQCNTRNCGNPKNNTSGVKGVSWNKQSKKWRSNIKVNFKQLFLGLYKSFDNAVCARLAAEQCLNWKGCDSNSPACKYVKANIK